MIEDKELKLICNLCGGLDFTVYVTMIHDYYDDYVATYEGATVVTCNSCLARTDINVEIND